MNCEKDIEWLIKAMGRNYPPTEEQMDIFCEKVAIFVYDFDINEDKARVEAFKLVRNKML